MKKHSTCALLASKDTLVHFMFLHCSFTNCFCSSTHSIKNQSKSRNMELELGLKISKTIVDFTSSADLLIAKDRFGPVFVSKETESLFVLTAHLKGPSLSLPLSLSLSLTHITLCMCIYVCI